MDEKEENSLINLKQGECGIISQLNAGWQAAKRLSDLGLTPGTEVKIVRKAPLAGPVELEVRGSKLVIGRGLASKVLCRVKKKS